MDLLKGAPPKSVPRIAESVVGVMAGLALAGWAVGAQSFTTLRPGFMAMNANTAAAFLLLVGALHWAASGTRFRWQQALGAGAALAGLLTLLEYTLGRGLGIDQALFHDPAPSPHPGRMAVIPAMNFMLLGTALLLPRFKYSDYMKELLALGVALSSTFAIVGYLYGVPALYGVVSSRSTATALHSGVGFLVLAIGFLFVERETGFVRVFHGPSIASLVARVLVPVAAVVPVGLGALFFRSRWNADHPQLVTALSVVADIVLLVVLIWVFAFMIQKVEMARAQAQHLAETDRLTGIYNRRYFEISMEAEVNRAQRYGSPLSLIIFDIDSFKKLNDRYGHLAGDQVLRQLVRQCEPNLRSSDIFCRYGGEEFAIIAPETRGPAALSLARRVRESVESMRLENIPEKVTISAGVAEWSAGFKGGDELIAATDAALYQAKNAGRNRECLYEQVEKGRAS